jgi:D-glycero-D-manno-heptose 1,7-bisphosphate phosphatase
MDRDGTLNPKPPEHEYLRSAADFSWLAGAAEGAAALAHAGFALFVVSNQRGVARGLVELDTLRDIEALIQSGLTAHDARIEAFSYCPHDIPSACSCRKPAPGMLLALAAERGLDLARSWMIGDSLSDVQAGRAAGCATAWIAPPVPGPAEADIHAASLRAAAEQIIARAAGAPAPYAAAAASANSATRAS